MKYYIWILGCQMNKSDSERISGLLTNAGWKACSKEEDADLIIAVACSVRQSAINRFYGCALKYKKLRAENKKLKIILTGCVLESDKEKLGKIFDNIINIKDIAKELPPAAWQSRKKTSVKNIIPGKKSAAEEVGYFKIVPKYVSSFQAYVPIMTGCNNFCAYCVVPYTRGREWSRPVEDILAEVEKLINNGYKEITLIGQNVNSYKSTLSDKLSAASPENNRHVTFPDLLKMINAIPGDFWIRFATSHPKDMSDELINTIAESEKITPYIHLPIQAGSTRILKAMNRKYTKAHYLKLIEKIKNKIPEVMLSTDIIVGFPGETKKNFLETADVFKKVRYTMAYIARYSPRAGTAASLLKDNISAKEKAEREKILTDILKETARENNKKLVGQKIKVLVEKKIPASDGNSSPKEKYYIGKSARFVNVKFRSRKNLIGEFALVKINKADSWGMEGEAI